MYKGTCKLCSVSVFDLEICCELCGVYAFDCSSFVVRVFVTFIPLGGSE